MNIAYDRYGCIIDLFLEYVSSGGITELRAPFIRRLCLEGNTVYILCKVTKRTFELYKERINQEEFSWLKNLVLMQGSLELPLNIDMYLLENGSTNICFGEDDIALPLQFQTYIRLTKYEGLVMIIQTDYACPTPLFPEAFSFTMIADRFKKKNVALTETGLIEYACSHDVLKNKRYIVLTPGRNTNQLEMQHFLSDNTANGGSYADIRMPIVHFDIHKCASENEMGMQIVEDYEDKKLVYIGADRDRFKNESIGDLYLPLVNSHGYKVDFWGSWPEGKSSGQAYLHSRVSNKDSIQFKGRLGMGLGHTTYNKSFGHIVVGDEGYVKIKMTSGRFWEAIVARTLVFVDDRLAPSVDEFLADDLKDLLYVNKNNVCDKIEFIRSKGFKLRQEIIQASIDDIRKQDSSTVYQELLQIYKEQKDLARYGESECKEFFNKISLRQYKAMMSGKKYKRAEDRKFFWENCFKENGEFIKDKYAEFREKFITIAEKENIRQEQKENQIYDIEIKEKPIILENNQVKSIKAKEPKIKKAKKTPEEKLEIRKKKMEDFLKSQPSEKENNWPNNIYETLKNVNIQQKDYSFMYTGKYGFIVRVFNSSIEDIKKSCFSLERKNQLCAMCKNYKTNYGCGYFAPLFKDYSKNYKNCFVISVMLDNFYIKKLSCGSYSYILAERLTAKFISKITRELLLTAEKSKGIFAGNCRKCTKCLAKIQQPCRFPEKKEFSCEALGVNTEELLRFGGIELKNGWTHINGIKNDFKYMIRVSGVLHNNDFEKVLEFFDEIMEAVKVDHVNRAKLLNNKAGE